MANKFFKCANGGHILEVFGEFNDKLVCCGEEMKELVANTVDAALEKHTPAVTVDGNKVTAVVGEVEHPMLEEHYIMFIYLETTKGAYRKDLKPGEKPCAEFLLSEGEKPLAVYEYCNLHGLWKTEIK